MASRQPQPGRVLSAEQSKHSKQPSGVFFHDPEDLERAVHDPQDLEDDQPERDGLPTVRTARRARKVRRRKFLYCQRIFAPADMYFDAGWHQPAALNQKEFEERVQQTGWVQPSSMKDAWFWAQSGGPAPATGVVVEQMERLHAGDMTWTPFLAASGEAASPSSVRADPTVRPEYFCP